MNNNESYCNYRNKESCPLPRNCMISNIIYKTEISQADSTEKKFYIGTTAHSFKQRYNNHTKSSRDHKYSNKTVLSNYVWGLKNEGKDFTVNWSILKRAKRYERGAEQCDLCLEEKLSIVQADKKNLLNKRTGIFLTCRHRSKFLIDKIKTCRDVRQWDHRTSSIWWRTRLYIKEWLNQHLGSCLMIVRRDVKL